MALPASPVISLASPTTATITSDALATSRASFKRVSGERSSISIFGPKTFTFLAMTVSLVILAPLAYVIEALGATFLIPSSAVIANLCSPVGAQVPNILLRLSAKGPIRAILVVFLREGYSEVFLGGQNCEQQAYGPTF